MKYQVNENFNLSVFISTCIVGGVVLERNETNVPAQNGYFTLQGKALTVNLDDPSLANEAVVDAAVSAQG